MARYDGKRKLERNRLVREFKEAHPELSYKEIGVIFNLDASRIWRICNGSQYRTR